MGQTSNPVIRYPDATEFPDASQLRILAEDAATAISGVWDAPTSVFTPQWKASSSTGANLSIGNGSLTGQYVNIGPFTYATVELKRGTTTNVGSGAYWFGITPQPSELAWVHGAGHCFQGGTTSIKPISVMGVGGNGVHLVHADGGYVGSGISGGWSETGYIRFGVMYVRA